jgi:RNA polymerase sigma factor (sigma-70 family)
VINDFKQYELLIHSWVKPFVQSYEKDDLLQEGRLALWMAMQKYDKDIGNFIPYAHKCVRNHIINIISRQKPLTTNVSLSKVYVENKEPIEHLCPQLTQQQQKMIKMRQMGYTYKEIASILNMSLYKIKQKIRQTIDIIKRANDI